MPCRKAPSGEEAVRKLETEPCHVVITDIRLGDLSGVDILKKAKEVNSGIEVILMTAYATVETAVQALRLGAYDYIQKPFDMDRSFSTGSVPPCGWAGCGRAGILPEGRVPERPR